MESPKDKPTFRRSRYRQTPTSVRLLHPTWRAKIDKLARLLENYGKTVVWLWGESEMTIDGVKAVVDERQKGLKIGEVLVDFDVGEIEDALRAARKCNAK